jgi:hypothetical protein
VAPGSNTTCELQTDEMNCIPAASKAKVGKLPDLVSEIALHAVSFPVPFSIPIPNHLCLGAKPQAVLTHDKATQQRHR